MKDEERLTQWLANLQDCDDDQGEAIVQRIASLGETASAKLSQAYQSADAGLRWWIVRASAELPGQGMLALDLKALGDPDREVRHCAALALQQRASPEAVDALVACLGDNDSLLARLSANALVAIGKPAVPALVLSLQSAPAKVRMEAVRALALIGDTRCVPILFNLLEDESSIVEYWAAEGLERMGIGMSFFHPGL